MRRLYRELLQIDDTSESNLNIRSGDHRAEMFLTHQREVHGYQGSRVKVNLFEGAHRYYIGKMPVATVTSEPKSPTDKTVIYRFKFHNE